MSLAVPRSLCLALPLSLVACHTWPHTHVDLATIDRAADDPCEALVDDARERGVRLFISDGGVHFHTLVLASDEPWVVRGHVERIRRGGWLTVRRQRGRAYEVRLACSSRLLELPVHSCRRRGRVYAIVDPRALEGAGAWGTPERPCRLSIGVRVRDDWSWWSLDAIVRPSARAQIEGRR